MGILLGIFFSSMGIGFSGALMPGPMLSVCIAESYKKGFWAGPLIVLGHSLPEFALMVLFSLGLNKFVTNDTVTGIIGIVGGLFLGWLAATVTDRMLESHNLDLFLITPRLALGSVAFAILLGLVSGLYPSLHAARLRPVLALRYE